MGILSLSLIFCKNRPVIFHTDPEFKNIYFSICNQEI